MTWLYIWLAVTAISLLLEFATNEMVSIWFAGGGLVAMILAGLKLEWYVHLPTFIGLSLVLMFCFRKLVIKKFSKGEQNTNADAAFGKEFELLTPIAFNQPGTIRVNDVVWNVVCEDLKGTVEQGRLVKVLALKGNKYVVEEVK